MDRDQLRIGPVDLGYPDDELLSGAADAVKNGLRKSIESARGRLKECSIDFRGFGAGKRPSRLLAALIQVFGAKKDEVTAPEWNQTFGEFDLRLVSLDCDPPPFRALAQSDSVRGALSDWAGLLSLRRWLIDNAVPPNRWPNLIDEVKLMLYLDEHTPELPVFVKGADPRPGGTVIISYGYICDNDPTHGRKIWARSLWADPPAAAVDKFVREWKKIRKKPNLLPQTVPLLWESETGTAPAYCYCAADPSFAEHIQTGTP